MRGRNLKRPRRIFSCSVVRTEVNVFCWRCFVSHLSGIHFPERNECAKPNPAYDAGRTPAWAIIKRKNNFLFRAAPGMSTRINIGLRLFIGAALPPPFYIFGKWLTTRILMSRRKFYWAYLFGKYIQICSLRWAKQIQLEQWFLTCRRNRRRVIASPFVNALRTNYLTN